jgi:UDP-N-acetylglucosamine 4-epimerase
MDTDLEKQLLESTSEKWLVTRVAGFIGSHIAETLLNYGQTVYGVDNFSTGKQVNIDLLNNISKDKFKFFETDINNREVITSLVSKCSYVIHQAALGSVPRSVENPVNSHNSNVNGFLTLLDIVKSHKNIKRVVYASSSSVYGDSTTLPKKEGEEGHVLSPYAATKRINEIYADSFSKSYGISIIGLRYFIINALFLNMKG